MRSKCAIQQTIYLLKVMFRWIQLLAITEQRCNDEFMLGLIGNTAIILFFLPPIVRVDWRKIKQN